MVITRLLFILIATAPALASAATLTVRLPEGMRVTSASVSSWGEKGAIGGKVDLAARTVSFADLRPDVRYDVALVLADGAVLQGVDLGWYGLDAGKPAVGAMSDDDVAAVNQLFADVKTFENKKRILQLRGDADRCTALVELVRDTEFHASGANIVWRVELWYYKSQFGGWQKVQQQSRVLRRERFNDQKAFEAGVSKVKWRPELGGIVVGKGREVTVGK
ncbi:MAG TPA: hypothetical protein VEA69_20835 [Tepidisphaeraceae bacterium]|nr:hypothetical protein [Tepidisphaeraceae bacterium]